MLNIKAFTNGLKIKPVTSSGIDTEGEQEVFGNHLRIYLGAAIREVITADQFQTLTNKTFSSPTFAGALTLPQIATPSTPSAGFNRLYFKSDYKLYQLDEFGTELTVGSFNVLFGSTPNSNGGGFSAGVLTLQPASASFPGGVSTTTQTFAGAKTFTGAISASNLSGTNTGDQTITLTGDVTGSGTGSFAATIANDSVSNAKLSNVATATFKGRTTSGTGDPEDLTSTQATALLNVFTSSLQGLAPASGGGTINFLRADGTFAIPTGTGANTALSNLITTAINTNLLPNIDGSRTLGSTGAAWGSVYATDLRTTGGGRVLNITSRFLQDSGGDSSLNWQNKQLVLGSTVKLDWSGTNVLFKAGIALEDPGAGTNTVTIQSPTLASSYTLTLPVDDGTVGQVLTTDGSGVLSWATGGGGSGDVVGPGSSTDNAVTRFDSITGKLIQNSTAILSDAGELTLSGAGQNSHLLINKTIVTSGSTGVGQGIQVNTTQTANGTGEFLVGIASTLTIATTDMDQSTAIYANSINNSTASIELNGVLVDVQNGSSKTVASLNGIKISTSSNSGTITDYAGLYISGAAVGGTVSGFNDAIHVVTGRSFFGGNIALKESGGSDTVTITVPALAASYTLTLPVNDGASGEVLSTDGSGVLSWISNSAGANTTLSNLTSPTAINQDLILNNGNSVKFTQSDAGTNFVAITAPATIGTSYTLTLPVDDGTSSQVLTTDGSGVLSWTTPASTGAYNTSIKTTTYTAVDKDEIFANSSGGAFTITLPASPTIGQRVKIIDYSSNWAANNVTVGRNSSNINGAAADFTLNINDAWAEFIYVDVTRGWRVVS